MKVQNNQQSVSVVFTPSKRWKQNARQLRSGHTEGETRNPVTNYWQSHVYHG